MSETRSERGFTLIELLVVIGILSLLMIALLPPIIETSGAAHTLACRARLKKLDFFIRLYETKFGHKPSGRGIAMLRELWQSGVMEHTPENRDLMFCPHDEDDPHVQWIKAQDIDELWTDGFESRDTSWAARADGRLRNSGRQAWVADDNEFGNNHQDGSINVLYGNGAVRTIHPYELRRRGRIPNDPDYVIPVGPSSPVPELRELRSDS